MGARRKTKGRLTKKMKIVPTRNGDASDLGMFIKVVYQT
jgi:hypothetical protein